MVSLFNPTFVANTLRFLTNSRHGARYKQVFIRSQIPPPEARQQVSYFANRGSHVPYVAARAVRDEEHVL